MIRDSNCCLRSSSEDEVAGEALGRAALLFESDDGLAACDGDFSVDHSALCDRNAAGDDIGVDDGGRTYFQFLLDNQLAGDASGYDGGLSMDFTFPLRPRGHAQCPTYATIAAYRATYDQWAAGLDVAGQVAPFSYKCR